MIIQSLQRERETLDQFDPVATSEEFQAWMQRHCVWLRTSSLFALSTGVIVLFAACGTLVQGRFNHSFETRQVTATVIFWSFAAATVLFIIALELKEHISSKQKSGVYSMNWKDALRSRRHRFQQDATELSKLGEDVRDNIHREVEQQEQTSYSQCPDAEAVAERGAQFSKLAVDRRLMRGKTRSVIFETLDLPGDTWTPEETKSQLRDVVQEVRNLDEHHANNVDGSTKKQMLSSLFSQIVQLSDDDMRSDVGDAAATVRGDMPIVDATGHAVDMQSVRKLAGQFFRSTLVHVRNGTDSDITLRVKTMYNGVFEEEIGGYKLKVPVTVPAKGEAVFLSRGRAFAGVSGEVEYMTRDRCWSFKLRWSNFVLVGDDGRFCETELIHNAEEEQHTENQYRIFKEDDDQTVNNEVYFSIKTTSAGEAGRTWQDSGHAGAAIKADWVQIKPFSDWVWMKRWISLTGQALTYYASKTEKVQEGQLNISEVTDVFPSGPTELTLVGKERSQHSEDNEETTVAQQLPLRMWFTSTTDRDVWMDALMLASPLLASWNRTSSLSLAAGLDELAKKQIEFSMNFDQLLALYFRIIHGDKEKVIDMQQTFSAASKLTADEATEAMLLVLVRMLTEEQLHYKQNTADTDRRDAGAQNDQLAHDETESENILPVPSSSSSTVQASDVDPHDADVSSRSYSAKDWVDIVERWGGANVWTGLRTRDKVLLVGQRLLDSGLMVAIFQNEETDPNTSSVFSEDPSEDGSSRRYRFVSVQCACSAAALATANIHAPTPENGADESSTSRLWKRSSSKTEAPKDDTFTASEATDWLLARGGNVEHSGGPSGFCEQLCECGLLTHVVSTVESPSKAEQRYRVRRCTGRWELHLVPVAADAEAAAHVSPDSGTIQPPNTPGPMLSNHDHEYSVGTLEGSLVDHLHTPSREEFLRHAAMDGNEVRSCMPSQPEWFYTIMCVVDSKNSHCSCRR
jgi:hypothetical protein